MDAVGHWDDQMECDVCTWSFSNDTDKEEHQDALDHWRRDYECEVCDRAFRTQEAANNHMHALKHYRHYCRECDRRFRNNNDVKMVVQLAT
jgi:hypothetical protein